MQIIKRGAEAILYKGKLDGYDVLVKERVRKKYRLAEIDERIRKMRTREEAKLLSEARAIGVNTPQLINIDEDESKIFMQFIDGERVKDFVKSAADTKLKSIFGEIGKIAAKLHNRGIIHGDLTTSNMILHDGKIYLIDFGLGFFSRRIEDKAMDLSLFFEALRATHYKKFDLCWRSFLSGYKAESGSYADVMRQIEEIEGRGRYAE